MFDIPALLQTGIKEILPRIWPKDADPDLLNEIQGRIASEAAKVDMAEIAKTHMALNNETGSSDKFVSRARPTFLYIVYAIFVYMLLVSLIAIPQVLYNHFAAPMIPLNVTGIMIGTLTSGLAGIPEAVLALFGSGYLGYTAAREVGKNNKLKKGQ